MARFNPPEPFSSKPNEWLEWLDEFIAIFQIATKLHKEEGDVQRDSLLDAMGGGGGGGQQANIIFRTLTSVAPEVDTKDETPVSKLTEYFIPQRNVIHERCVFQSRQQLANESVEEFARELQTLAANEQPVPSGGPVSVAT